MHGKNRLTNVHMHFWFQFHCDPRAFVASEERQALLSIKGLKWGLCKLHKLELLVSIRAPHPVPKG